MRPEDTAASRRRPGNRRGVRGLLALALAALLPASLIGATPAVASGVPLIHPCCCRPAVSQPVSPLGEAELERGSPCAFAQCCADEAPPARLEVAGHVRSESAPIVALTSHGASCPAPRSARLVRLPRLRAPPPALPSLLLRKRSFLL